MHVIPPDSVLHFAFDKRGPDRARRLVEALHAFAMVSNEVCDAVIMADEPMTDPDDEDLGPAIAAVRERILGPETLAILAEMKEEERREQAEEGNRLAWGADEIEPLGWMDPPNASTSASGGNGRREADTSTHVGDREHEPH